MLIPSPRELALCVVAQRKKLKLSQAEVADRVGLKQKTVSAFENKPENAKLSTAFYILSAVNLDMSLTTKDKITSSKTAWKEEW